jgi:hypothetical protein
MFGQKYSDARTWSGKTGRMRLAILTVAGVVLSSAWTSIASASEIYHWTDEEGVLHFSDSRPDDGALVTTIYVEDRNPPDYDPASDPYSIRKQAERTNAMWAELEKAKEDRQEKRREAQRKARVVPSPYDPYAYYYRPGYFTMARPGIRRPHPPKLARRQLSALEELDLAGPPAHSINSGGHHERILVSKNLPVVSPKPVPHTKMP